MIKATWLHKMQRTVLSVLLVGVFVFGAESAHSSPVFDQGTWETTLKARDIAGNAVPLSDADAVFFYDTKLNLTWLADWSGKPRTVREWTSAVAWAAGLNIGGYTGWRLPIVSDTGTPGCNWSDSGGTDCGYNVDTSTSELAHMPGVNYLGRSTSIILAGGSEA